MSTGSRAPNPRRFEVYTELKDGSGFTIKGCDTVFKFDRFGGWYDQFANYYNSQGIPEDPPSDSQHSDPLSRSEGDDHEDDIYEKEFGVPKNYYDDEDENDVFYGKVAANLEILNNYPSGQPYRVHFSNLPYVTRREQAFNYFKAKVPGILNLIFLENDKHQFNGNGYFVVDGLKAGQDLVKLEGEKYDHREIHFKVVDVLEFLQEKMEPEELYTDFKSRHGKKYVTKGQNQPYHPHKEEHKVEKPQPIKQQPPKETKVEVKPKVQEKKVEVKPEVVSKKVEVQPKVAPKPLTPEDFVVYKFLKTSFPKKSSFKEWLQEHKFSHTNDLKQVNKIQGDEAYALVTMKKKIYDNLNNTFYNGKKIIFQPQSS